MKENAKLYQVLEERGSLSQAQLLEIVCNALKIATEGDPDRLNHLLGKLEEIIKLNTDKPPEYPPTEECKSSKEQSHQGAK